MKFILRAYRLARQRCPHCGAVFVTGFNDTEETSCPVGHYVFTVFRGKRTIWRDRSTALARGASYAA